MDEQKQLTWEETLRQMRADLAEYPTLLKWLQQQTSVEKVAQAISHPFYLRLPERIRTVTILIDRCFAVGKGFQDMEVEEKTSIFAELISHLESIPFGHEWTHPARSLWQYVLYVDDPAVTDEHVSRVFHHVTDPRREGLLRCSLWRLKFLNDYYPNRRKVQFDKLVNELVDRDFNVEAFVEALNDPASASKVEDDLYRGRKNGHFWCDDVPKEVRRKIARNYRKALKTVGRSLRAEHRDRIVAAYRTEADAIVHVYARYANATDDEIRAFGIEEIRSFCLSYARACSYKFDSAGVCTERERMTLMRHPVDSLYVGPLNVRMERIQNEILEEQRIETQRVESQRREDALRVRDEERARQAHLEHARERIAARVGRIVGVFNGVYGLNIDPYAVLAGEVTGEYASISSSPSLSMGQSLQLKQVMELSHVLHASTWLQLEEGDNDAEIDRAYRSANFLVCHELGHLAPLAVVQEAIASSGVSIPSDPDLLGQAHEIVIDAIGYRLGTDLYVHPDDQAFSPHPARRRQIMRTSFEAMLERVMQRPEAVTDHLRSGFLARLCAVAKQLVDLDPVTPVARTFLDWCWSLSVSRDLVEVYRLLFSSVINRITVADIAFLPHVEASHETFAPVDAAPTLH